MPFNDSITWISIFPSNKRDLVQRITDRLQLAADKPGFSLQVSSINQLDWLINLDHISPRLYQSTTSLYRSNFVPYIGPARLKIYRIIAHLASHTAT